MRGIDKAVSFQLKTPSQKKKLTVTNEKVQFNYTGCLKVIVKS